MSESLTVAFPPEQAVKDLLAQANFESTYACTPKSGGRNNRVFLLKTPSRQVWLKSYFRHPSDPRDRLAQEFDFLNLLWQQGVRLIPEPYAANRNLGFALYEYIPGKTIPLEEVGDFEIESAIRFFKESNSLSVHKSACHIRPASEACFTILEHVQITRRRVDRLDQIERQSTIDEDAWSFIQKNLKPFAEKFLTFAANQKLPPTIERCLSPSDFGFHNSIRRTSGDLCFVDFEYAGWDDPAKTVADVANQPDMILPENLSRKFKESTINLFSKDIHLSHRIELLTPLYQLKWSCIILNEFLPFGRSRRDFQGFGEEKKKLALVKAHNMLERACISFEKINK